MYSLSVNNKGNNAKPTHMHTFIIKYYDHGTMYSTATHTAEEVCKLLPISIEYLASSHGARVNPEA
jgi:hypothetical protein